MKIGDRVGYKPNKYLRPIIGIIRDIGHDNPNLIYIDVCGCDGRVDVALVDQEFVSIVKKVRGMP